MCEGHPSFDTCFVMRRYKCSLLDEIKRVGDGGGIDLLRALVVLAEVAKTMASLHTAFNLVVADLKPSNILIDEHGDGVISDFGLSRVVTSTMGSFGMSPSKVGGTFNYQSPEQLGAEDGEGNALGVTTQSDVWNFACTALHAFTGEAPWWDASAGAPWGTARVVGAVVYERRPLPQLALLPAAAPAELRELLQSCFCFEASTRPRFFGAGESDARTPICGIAFRLARLRDAAAGSAAAAATEDGAAQQSTIDDIRDAIEAAGRWGDEVESSDPFPASAAAAAAPTLHSQASQALVSEGRAVRMEQTAAATRRAAAAQAHHRAQVAAARRAQQVRWLRSNYKWLVPAFFVLVIALYVAYVQAIAPSAPLLDESAATHAAIAIALPHNADRDAVHEVKVCEKRFYGWSSPWKPFPTLSATDGTLTFSGRPQQPLTSETEYSVQLRTAGSAWGGAATIFTKLDHAKKARDEEAARATKKKAREVKAARAKKRNRGKCLNEIDALIEGHPRLLAKRGAMRAHQAQCRCEAHSG